ncbi:3-oxoacyl-[acyl-carrier-protein] synthase-3 [Marinitoga hydrogenitolerans DSM 16785]|uniref:3-oxoacyl-[acyl-carrier-protein] synthase-3 n=1 Tax=Marinitoga hydrogenitolerans (strain DSM 16785 / JCM 12826 / AT1271) TaxID=1122195 RepID=A0A1M4S5I4_MARH1|nr:3-oxoacyl-[acyl-carrier-protein] synthase III C-terminal domain-containing protein [Marinitoga hydrogenitolerans]SHE27463.1 3-oxoacyl-[acyl-carrier-protein] synthase-3 [Marinitoga hydrogenitolerans DSM 16785]
MIISQINAFVPEKILDNKTLSKKFNVSEEWIYKRTGIKKRYISDMDVFQMGINAASSLNLDGVDTILFVSSIGAHYVPFYVRVFEKLKLKKLHYGIDISNGFVGFITALHVADVMFRENIANKILIIVSERLSELVEDKDINTAILFSDASVAMILENHDNYICDHKVMYDPNYLDALNINENKKIIMDGKRVYKFAVNNMKKIINKYIENYEKKIIVPHQANKRILESVKKSFNDLEFLDIIEDYGNTGAVSIPLTLFKTYGNSKIQLKDHLLISVGGGMTTSAITWRCIDE